LIKTISFLSFCNAIYAKRRESFCRETSVVLTGWTGFSYQSKDLIERGSNVFKETFHVRCFTAFVRTYCAFHSLWHFDYYGKRFDPNLHRDSLGNGDSYCDSDPCIHSRGENGGRDGQWQICDHSDHREGLDTLLLQA